MADAIGWRDFFIFTIVTGIPGCTFPTSVSTTSAESCTVSRLAIVMITWLVLRVLGQAGLVRGKRIKQWTFYRRDEKRIAAVKRALRSAW